MENIKTQNNLNINLNKFFINLKLKKQYVEKLKNKIELLNSLKEKNYKSLSSITFNTNLESSIKEEFLITYIIDITFSQTNTLLHVMDFSGNMKFFCSAGSLQYKGKRKKARYSVFRDMYRILVSKLKFLKGQPVVLHLKNVGSAKFWIIKLLKKKLFIKVIKSYDLYPYNGCRKKKLKRRNG